MGLLDELRTRMQSTLLREKLQQGLFDGSGYSAQELTPYENARAGIPSPTSRTMMYDDPTTGSAPNFGVPVPRLPLDPSKYMGWRAAQQRKLPGSGGGLPTNTASLRSSGGRGVDPRTPGLGGRQFPPRPDANAAIMPDMPLSAKINKEVTDNIMAEKGDKDKKFLTPSARAEIGDFLQGFRASNAARTGAQYNPARSGIRGAFHDVAEGLAGMRSQATARSAAELQQKMAVAKINNDTARAAAQMKSAEAATTQARAALIKVRDEVDLNTKKIPEDRRAAILKMTAQSIQEENEARAARFLDPMTETEVKQLAISTIKTLTDPEIQASLDEVYRGGTEPLKERKADTATPAPSSVRTLGDLLAPSK